MKIYYLLFFNTAQLYNSTMCIFVLVIAWVAVKFGINTTSVVLEMVNFTWLRLVKFIPISNTTLVVFIPNFTAIPMLFPVNTILAAYTHAVH